MYGAILGDIIGSPYEFDSGDKTKDFPLFIEESEFTDDSVMTVAIAHALMRTKDLNDDEQLKENFINSMRIFGNQYPNAGYGHMFGIWLEWDNPEPYGSFGNGSAMRVSPVAWFFDTLADVRRAARLSAEVSHNHPEGIKGAESVAAAIFLARKGVPKDEIKAYIETTFDYDLSRTCDEIRPTYHHVESCQGTVPEAIIAFLEGNDFEDVVRNAVSLGGDCDTLTAITASIAEGFYGVPEYLKKECEQRLPQGLLNVLRQFNAYRK